MPFLRWRAFPQIKSIIAPLLIDAGLGVIMFWKYIEKINWEKDIRNIFLLKNKRLNISITYKGYIRELGLECKNEYYFAMYGWQLRFTILGILFSFYFCDKRWYNDYEDRFYLEDEPRWVDGIHEDYWDRIEKFIQNHPELDDEYLNRRMQEWADFWLDWKGKSEKEYKLEMEEKDKLEKKEDYQLFIKNLKTPIDFNRIYKAIDPNKCYFSWLEKMKIMWKYNFYFGRNYLLIWFAPFMTCAAKWDGKYEVEFKSFGDPFGLPACGCGNWAMSLSDAFRNFDLYDRDNHLISRASDFKKK